MQPTNWPMISGRSGLPKFMLSVMASGVRADGGQVAPALGHRLLAAASRVGGAIARRAVGGQRQRLLACRACARPPRRRPGRCTVSAHHEVVVLLPDPALGGEVGAADAASSAPRSGRAPGTSSAVELGRGGGVRPRAGRRAAPRVTSGPTGRSAATSPSMRQHQPAGVGDAADDGEIQLPFLEDRAAPRPRCRA